MRDWIPDRAVLLAISLGLIAILLAIIIGILFHVPGKGSAAAIPNWAENVLVAIATGTLLKVGDAINALVALASGKQVGQLSTQLANSAPVDPLPTIGATEAAHKVADAAVSKADQIDNTLDLTGAEADR